jgi:hypothetical protein
MLQASRKPYARRVCLTALPVEALRKTGAEVSGEKLLLHEHNIRYETLFPQIGFHDIGRYVKMPKGLELGSRVIATVELQCLERHELVTIKL